MALSVTHSTTVVTADDPNYEVGSDEWNAAHSVSGVLGAANGGTGVANNASSTITISGAFGLTLTLSAATALTLPTSGTLATTSDKLSVFAATTSAELAGVISDETGSGALVFATSPTLVTPALGTPVSGTLTNCTGLPISSGVSGLAAGVATFLATPSSANLISAVTDETGTGSLVFATSPTLVAPALGTPASGTLTNCTGLPISTGVSGLAAGVATFLATPSSANLISAVTDETGTGSLVFATSPTLVTPALGTPTSGTLTNCTGLPISTGVSGLAAGIATFLATPSSANLASAVTDETGTGALVFGTSPTFTTGITVPLVIGGTGTGSTLTLESTSGAGTTDAIIFNTGSQTEAIRVTNSGAVSSNRSTGGWFAYDDNTTVSTDVWPDGGRMQIARQNYRSVFQTAYFANDAVGVRHCHGKSRGAAINSWTIVQSGDELLRIEAWGANGNAAGWNRAGYTSFTVDGTPGVGDMPGRWGVFTSPDGSATPVERLRIDSAGLSSFTQGAFGYGLAGNGDGGTVTQLTSKSTGVTLNTVCGQITMNNAALAAAAEATFTVTNSKVAANDLIIVNHSSGGTSGSYLVCCSKVAAGSFNVTISNASGGSLSEAVVIGFAVIKGVAS